MKKLLPRSGALALLVTLATLGGAGAAAPGAAAQTQPKWDCASAAAWSPCIRYCIVGPRVPCGVERVPSVTSGRYSYTVPLSEATQSATGVPGDPGGTGTASITMDQSNNSVCATTSWSGVDSPVVAAHIHGGEYGQPENPGITINMFPSDFVNGVSSPASGCATAPPGVILAIHRCPSDFNVVVHSKNHPVAAIRGQLGTGCAWLED